MEFNTEFLKFSSLGASIYRLTVQMSVWLDKTGPRLDGLHRPDAEFFDLQTVHNLLETLLNSGIPVKEHLYKEVILSNRMRPISN